LGGKLTGDSHRLVTVIIATVPVVIVAVVIVALIAVTVLLVADVVDFSTFSVAPHTGVLMSPVVLLSIHF